MFTSSYGIPWVASQFEFKLFLIPSYGGVKTRMNHASSCLGLHKQMISFGLQSENKWPPTWTVGEIMFTIPKLSFGGIQCTLLSDTPKAPKLAHAQKVTRLCYVSMKHQNPRSKSQVQLPVEPLMNWFQLQQQNISHAEHCKLAPIPRDWHGPAGPALPDPPFGF